jgi:hypothetical protein
MTCLMLLCRRSRKPALPGRGSPCISRTMRSDISVMCGWKVSSTCDSHRWTEQVMLGTHMEQDMEPYSACTIGHLDPNSSDEWGDSW